MFFVRLCKVKVNIAYLVVKVRKSQNDFFSNRHFLQKTNEQILLYYYETSGQLGFVRFLEEIEDTKRHFEII